MSIRKPEKKLYYSLRQTAEMVGIGSETIKGWERHFTQLEPMRDRAGNRHYTQKDISLLFLIKNVLDGDDISWEEAKHMVKRRSRNLEANENIQYRKTLAEAKLELQEILDILKG